MTAIDGATRRPFRHARRLAARILGPFVDRRIDESAGRWLETIGTIETDWRGRFEELRSFAERADADRRLLAAEVARLSTDVVALGERLSWLESHDEHVTRRTGAGS